MQWNNCKTKVESLDDHIIRMSLATAAKEPKQCKDKTKMNN